MNAATLRAVRETVGLSQRAVAEALEVTEQSVKYWERGLRSVPNGVAGWMMERAAEHDRAVSQTVDATLKMIEDQNAALELGIAYRPPVALTYWRTQAEYDAAGRDSGYFGVVNARSRDVATMLRGMGYEVEFDYPNA